MCKEPAQKQAGFMMRSKSILCLGSMLQDLTSLHENADLKWREHISIIGPRLDTNSHLS